MESQQWHALSVEETLRVLHAQRGGLSEKEAYDRLQRVGVNVLEEKKGASLGTLFFRQVMNPLILVLVASSFIKLALSNFLDGAVLIVTVLAMVLIGFFQEARAERAMVALKKLAAHKTKVMRGGNVVVLPSEKLVPGDEIFLEMGDKVPADARLVEVSNFKVDESALNGESMPSEKGTSEVAEEQLLVDRTNMVYMGTVVAYGKAIACVVNTGMSTELGKIAKSIKEIVPEPTPLQKSIAAISHWMLGVVCVATLFFSGISFYKGLDLVDIFFLAIAAAVSAIPEGLPIVVTATLATGMHLMAKRKAIIRKLIAVETLGATTVICSDKTGTLTMNRMTVTTFYTLDQTLSLSGDRKAEGILRRALEIGVLCNDALLSKESGAAQVIGDPLEGALLVSAAQAGLDIALLKNLFPRIGEIPFLSENLYMATLHSSQEGRVIYVKGAPEKVLALSRAFLTPQGVQPLHEGESKTIRAAMEQLSSQALRIIALAYYPVDPDVGVLTEELFRGKLIFCGALGMMDPPRQEAIRSIEACKRAGIHVAMITGDNPKTALAIAQQLGIGIGNAMTGQELKEMSDEELKGRVRDVSVFARVEPIQKLRLVRAFQGQGEVVAMTGDGVNDAPALEAANIGIAMSLSGTDVAKEAADMILADDCFDSIVAAVEEGRAIFNRLRSGTTFLLTTCLGELFGLILNVSYTGIAPLIPLQILWLNLISGSIIAIALGFEPKSGEEMNHPPRPPRTKLIDRRSAWRIGYLAFFLGVGSFFVFLSSYQTESLEKARTMVLCSIVGFEWLIASHMRSETLSVFRLGIFSNRVLLLAIGCALMMQLAVMYLPWLQELFHTTPLSLDEWLFVLIPGFFLFLFEGVRKRYVPKRRN